ncbi:U2 small nuclear ribonucleoprotein B''-like [Octopus sinensis]|uniref:U2 small nuclear ribonucleoprotein B''-like n=1 Tax=Octopus sinensis TaxID=2607531 RepID=A0A6P7U375_9MOLL|nr:U2 small nuclear ribonucleoprotein B''-like [Octopus sinensis]XP_029655344.1 U2 small nuclear ribonucleoprotein B''-like [Octopus sinensis]
MKTLYAERCERQKEELQSKSKRVRMDVFENVECPPDASSVLFVENIPSDATEHDLNILFKKFSGFKELRYTSARPEVSFVEYENETCATAALQSLQNFKLSPTHFLAISYAKV